jgi:hypothetical protein
MKKIGLLFVSALLLVGCGNALTEREKAELGGAQLINQAREAFVGSDYTTAVVLIDSIRDSYPLALNAREEGILLKDSVLLEQAREELRNAKDIAGDSIDMEELHMKVTFYERKLQHDLEQKQTH